jgi:hypothetical protein
MIEEQDVKEEQVEYVIEEDEVFILDYEDDGGKLDEDDESGNLSESMLESDDETSKYKGSGLKRDGMGEKVLDLGQACKTIRAAQRAASSLRCLNPTQQSTESVSTGSFTNDGDDRIRLLYTEHNLRSRISTTISFGSTQKQSCVGCVLVARMRHWLVRVVSPLWLLLQIRTFPCACQQEPPVRNACA